MRKLVGTVDATRFRYELAAQFGYRAAERGLSQEGMLFELRAIWDAADKATKFICGACDGSGMTRDALDGRVDPEEGHCRGCGGKGRIERDKEA